MSEGGEEEFDEDELADGDDEVDLDDYLKWRQQSLKNEDDEAKGEKK